MHGNSKTGTTQQNHNTKYNVVHPQCRGYVHKLRFIPLSSKPQFICALSCRFLLPLTAAHTAVGFYAHSCRPFLLSYKTLCAHSCRGRPRTQLGLVPSLLHLIFLTSKSLTYPFSISAYLYCAAYKNHGLKPWAPTETLTLDLTHGFITKREGFDLP